MKNRLYRDVINDIRIKTGRNIVAWAANNKGNGTTNLHVAELVIGQSRAYCFNDQVGILQDGFTCHWRGCASERKIMSAIH